MNGWDIILILLLAGVVVLAVRHIVKTAAEAAMADRAAKPAGSAVK